jgi:hypothetical protein
MKASVIALIGAGLVIQAIRSPAQHKGHSTNSNARGDQPHRMPGAMGSVHFLPESLQRTYGDRPLSGLLFVRAKL